LPQAVKLKNKYFLFKEVESINDENSPQAVNKGFNTAASGKYTDYLIVFIFICLFCRKRKFINIYFSSNLAENIDSFVKVSA
jgi:hypothetical protein